ncbi:MAG: hypothetical protein GTN80_00655 [Nitrososphaeria archaeon]|nr:hypothetical protein [Nitrososphaeria archaeon]NIQ32156.1 hypothetical protein [Nitrososphaeria archaeon]
MAYYVSERCGFSVSKAFATRLAREMGYKTQLTTKIEDGHLKRVRIISTR